jgi:hypothetical protein
MLLTLFGMVMLVRFPQSQKAYPSMLLTLFGIVTLGRPQFRKADSPIILTLFGMVTLARLVQLRKALSPMLVTPLYKTTVERLTQSEKAWLSMRVTLPGIVTLARFLQLKKATSKILLTLFGMLKEVNVVPFGQAIKVFLSLLNKIPLSEEYELLLDSTFIEVRLSQPIKTVSPILVTLFGIVILIRL